MLSSRWAEATYTACEQVAQTISPVFAAFLLELLPCLDPYTSSFAPPCYTEPSRHPQVQASSSAPKISIRVELVHHAYRCVTK